MNSVAHGRQSQREQTRSRHSMLSVTPRGKRPGDGMLHTEATAATERKVRVGHVAFAQNKITHNG